MFEKFGWSAEIDLGMKRCLGEVGRGIELASRVDQGVLR